MPWSIIWRILGHFFLSLGLASRWLHHVPPRVAPCPFCEVHTLAFPLGPSRIANNNRFCFESGHEEKRTRLSTIFLSMRSREALSPPDAIRYFSCNAFH